jgi:hypothetical protein
MSRRNIDFLVDYPSIEVRGFNIRPGAVFLRDESAWVATTKVTVDSSYEVVHIVARDAIDRTGMKTSWPRPESFTFDFCEKIQVVGFVMNPNDEDDNDWGTDPVVQSVGPNGSAVL